MARALPTAVLGHGIIVGSLAAGYNFFSGDGAASMRTKDVDMLLLPHALGRMCAALSEKLGGPARDLALHAGRDIDALLDSETDLEKGLRIANLGFLASLVIGMRAIETSLERLPARAMSLAGFPHKTA